MGRERYAESGLDRSGDRLFELPSQERFVPRCRQLTAQLHDFGEQADRELTCMKTTKGVICLSRG